MASTDRGLSMVFKRKMPDLETDTAAVEVASKHTPMMQHDLQVPIFDFALA